MAKPGYRYRIKWGTEDPWRELRQDYRVHAALTERAERIAEAAANTGGGEPVKGYKVTNLVLEKPRAAVSVMATGKAHNHARKHNTLVRSLDAGKG